MRHDHVGHGMVYDDRGKSCSVRVMSIPQPPSFVFTMGIFYDSFHFVNILPSELTKINLQAPSLCLSLSLSTFISFRKIYLHYFLDKMNISIMKTNTLSNLYSTRKSGAFRGNFYQPEK